MKAASLSLTISVMLPLSGVVFAKISLEDTSQTSFDISGTISAECKVTNTVTDTANSLDLASATAQNASTVSVWCNTGQSAADTTYSSVNNGYLINETGNRIAYSINVGQQANNLSLASPQTIEQFSGIGVNGETIATDVAIVPQVNGFETSGAYSDTISVTVTIN